MVKISYVWANDAGIDLTDVLPSGCFPSKLPESPMVGDFLDVEVVTTLSDGSFIDVSANLRIVERVWGADGGLGINVTICEHKSFLGVVYKMLDEQLGMKGD